jgi:hypothetical protein
MSILKLRKTVYACILAGCAGLLFSGMSVAVPDCDGIANNGGSDSDGRCVCTENGSSGTFRCKVVTP